MLFKEINLILTEEIILTVSFLKINKLDNIHFQNMLNLDWQIYNWKIIKQVYLQEIITPKELPQK